MFAALKREADKLTALGDPRSRGQVMADTLVARVTNATHGAVGGSPVVPMAINLVISQACLLGEADDPAGDDPAWVEGYGWIPADLARELVRESLDAGLKTWLRRVFTRPGTGELIAMDSRSRLVPAALAHFLGLRDQTCRTPWCDAPIRHRDHIVAVEEGGETSAANTQGLCEACNYAKQAHGWTARPRPGPRHTVETTTPTGHTYTSTAPPPVGTSQLPNRHRLDTVYAHLDFAA